MFLRTSLLSFACFHLLGYATALPTSDDTKTVERDVDDPLSPWEDGHFKCKEYVLVITDQHRAGTGCTLATQDSFEAGSSFEVGASLGFGIEQVLSLGLTLSVSSSTSKAYTLTDNTEKGCPKGDWYCGLFIYYDQLQVSGFKIPVTMDGFSEEPFGPVCNEGEGEPYTINYPIELAEGELAGISIDVCACPNAKGWADNGAPSKVCPGPCKGIHEGE
ncbi:MAG: hypothetical protein LQ346_003796 [Caloplaca aetnensis]|nr:MAG: hypothetical protein LQ346_003796 [Caloplaca aetnensis]